jgi:hypothetical protein
MRQMTAQPTIATRMAAVLMRIMAVMGLSWGEVDEDKTSTNLYKLCEHV